jgi:hypothetical protein
MAPSNLEQYLDIEASCTLVSLLRCWIRHSKECNDGIPLKIYAGALMPSVIDQSPATLLTAIAVKLAGDKVHMPIAPHDTQSTINGPRYLLLQDSKVVMGSGSFSDVVPANLRLASKANMRASMVSQHLTWSEPSSTHVAKLVKPATDVSGQSADSCAGHLPKHAYLVQPPLLSMPGTSWSIMEPWQAVDHSPEHCQRALQPAGHDTVPGHQVMHPVALLHVHNLSCHQAMQLIQLLRFPHTVTVQRER